MSRRVDQRGFRRSAGAVALVLGLAAAGCSGSTRSSTATQQSGHDAVTPGGRVVYGADAEPSTFNNRTVAGNAVAVRDLMRRVWPSVWVITPTFDVVLDTDLVTSVEITKSDPQTIVYRINPKATWSDGVPISADDFIFNWQAVQPGAKDIDGQPMNVSAPGEENIQSVTGSDDDKTVTVVLKEASADWKAIFLKSLVPAHIARRVGWNTGFDKFDPKVVISGGPYIIASHNPGSDLSLVRNEQYWGKKANLDSILLRFITDSSEAVTALRNREVDVVAPRVQTDLVAQIRSIPDVRSEVIPGSQYEFIDFNLKNELLALPAVRTAFALALDRPTIVARTVGQVDSRARVMNDRLYVTTQKGYADTSGGRYDRPDVATARSTLEAGGFVAGQDGVYAKDGKRLAFRITTTTGDALRDSQEQLIQAQVKQAGIELQIANVSASVITKTLSSGGFDIANLFQTEAPFVSATSPTFTTNGSQNLAGYSNPEVDRLYNQARAEPDDSRREALYHQIDTILWTDLPRIPLYQRPIAMASRDTLGNMVANPSLGPLWNAELWGTKAAPGKS